MDQVKFLLISKQRPNMTEILLTRDNSPHRNSNPPVIPRQMEASYGREGTDQNATKLLLAVASLARISIFLTGLILWKCTRISMLPHPFKIPFI